MKKISLSLEFLDPVFQNIEKLSKGQRIAICCGTFVLAIGLFVWLSYLPGLGEIRELKNERETVNTRLATAQRNAMQLQSFRDKMKTAEAQFNRARKALPEKEEIPSLLTSISKSGQDAGLDFLLFQPRPETPREFYAEIPLSLKVAGNYHTVALFFDKVAKLSRIVNIRDIKMIAPAKNEILETACTAVTYKFIEAPPPEAKK
jgi:type IV pilus assembly protein PilO